MEHMDVRYTLFEPSDFEQVLEILQKNRIVLAQVTRRSVYKAVLSDALKRKMVFIAVARRGSRVLGFIIVITNWKKYWKWFIVRHPLSSAFIIFSHLIKKVQLRIRHKRNLRSLVHGDDVESASQPKRSWSESSPEIAKVVYTWVDHTERGKGMAVNLYHFLIHFLAKQRVLRMDALVNSENEASIRTLKKIGFQFGPDWNNMVFMTYDIR